MLKHFTNNLCPFAHRAMFARALCGDDSLRERGFDAIETIHIPYGRQVEFALEWGMGGGGDGGGGCIWQQTELGAKMSSAKRNAVYGDVTSPEMLRDRKREYMASINVAGEVPSLELPSGTVLTESEVVMEFFAPSSLVPADPEQAARMRLAIRRFESVTPLLFRLLNNQVEEEDAVIEKRIVEQLGTFLSVIDPDGGFCFGGSCTLADIYCSTVLYRLDVGLSYWRAFSVRGVDPRVSSILDAVTALPAWQAGLVGDEEIYTYELPAHGNKWAADGKGFAGRGRKESKQRVQL